MEETTDISAQEAVVGTPLPVHGRPSLRKKTGTQVLKMVLRWLKYITEVYHRVVRTRFLEDFKGRRARVLSKDVDDRRRERRPFDLQPHFPVLHVQDTMIFKVVYVNKSVSKCGGARDWN